MGIASIRTNAFFVLLFFNQETIFCLLAANHYALGRGISTYSAALNKAAGSLAFVNSVIGWYLLAAMLFLSVGLPIKLPVFDLSFVLKLISLPRKKEDKARVSKPIYIHYIHPTICCRG